MNNVVFANFNAKFNVKPNYVNDIYIDLFNSNVPIKKKYLIISYA